MGRSKDLATGETRFVNTTGDTMSGDLTTTGNVGIGGDPVKDFHVRDDNSFGGGTRIVAAFSPSITNGQDAGLAFGTYSPDDYWKQGIFWERTGSYGLGHLHFANRGSADTTTVSKADAKMTINSNGTVTIPNQPAFDVAQPNQSSGDHTWGQTHLNRGNHYNSSNGRFTAPVAGVYIFFHGGIKGANSTTTSRLYVKKNGSRLYSQRHLRLDGSTNQYGENGSLQWIVELAVNDYIQAETGAGTAYTSTGEYNVFSGYLIG